MWDNPLGQLMWGPPKPKEKPAQTRTTDNPTASLFGSFNLMDWLTSFKQPARPKVEIFSDELIPSDYEELRPGDEEWFRGFDGVFRVNPMKTLYPFQRGGVRIIDKVEGRALIGDEMGLGKTPQSLTWINNERLERCPALVVCPAGLKINWEREAARWCGIRAEVLDGRKPKRLGFQKHHLLHIINYEIFEAWYDYLVELNPQTIIIDEAQYLKNRTAKRTKTIMKFVHSVNVPFRLGLSGTAVEDRPADIWPICNILWPEEFPSFYPFANRYCKPERKFWGWVYNGAENLEELHIRLKKCGLIRRLKRQVLTQLPRQTRVVLPVEISNRAEYLRAEKDLISWIATYDPLQAKRAAKAEALVRTGYWKRLVGRLKVPAVLQWTEDFLQESNGKIIIFAIHKFVIQAIHDRFKDISVVIDGSKTKNQRQKAIDDFDNNKKVRILIGNIIAAGVGWNGTVAQTVAFAELSWMPAKHTQAAARVDRIGQKSATMAYYLIGHGTFEEKLCQIIQEKQDIQSAILDGQGRGERLNIHDEFLTAIRKRGKR